MPTKDLEHIVGQLVATITFTVDWLTRRNRTCQVTSLAVACRGMIISRVLIDNGSSLNVCHVITLERIEIEESLTCPNGMMVGALMALRQVLIEK